MKGGESHSISLATVDNPLEQRWAERSFVLFFREWYLTKLDVLFHLTVYHEHFSCHHIFFLIFLMSAYCFIGQVVSSQLPCSHHRLVRLFVFLKVFINNGTMNMFTDIYFFILRWIPRCDGLKNSLTQIPRCWSRTHCFIFLTTFGYFGVSCALCGTVSEVSSL